MFHSSTLLLGPSDGTMPTHTVTQEASDQQWAVESDAVPGVELQDPECNHGCDFDMRQQGMTPFQAQWHPHVHACITQFCLCPE